MVRVEAGPPQSRRLSTETPQERRERFEPRQIGQPRLRRRIVLVVTLVLVAGVWFGIVPGSSALGRYPVWELKALADRINTTSDRHCRGDDTARASVDVVRGRVVLTSRSVVVSPFLSEREQAMIDGPAYAAICNGDFAM